MNELLLLLLTLSVAGAARRHYSRTIRERRRLRRCACPRLCFSILGDQNLDLIFVAIGTSLATIVVSSARAVQAHQRRGAVDFDVLKTWALWLVLGVFIGLIIASMTNGDRVYAIFAIGVLIYALYFLFPDRFSNQKTPAPKMPTDLPRAGPGLFSRWIFGLLGIGGGTVTVITMVTCQRPIYQAVATASGVGFIIGLAGAVGFAFMGLGQPSLPYGSIGYVNFPALLTVGTDVNLTAPVGAKWAHSLDENILKRLFGVYLILVSIAMFWKSTQV